MNDQIQYEKELRQYLLKFAMARETLDKENLTSEEVDAEICRRLQDGIDDEYLVDGAILTCTKATRRDFGLSDGSSVEITGNENKKKSGKPIEFLRVWENPMLANGLRHATVEDTVQDSNIMPFPCNCMESATLKQEKEIKENIEACHIHGVCKYLMDLEKEWENINFEVPYATFTNVKPRPLKEGEELTSYQAAYLTELKDGITMTSVLFCRHGGFIYPLTSGQTLLTAEEEAFAQAYNLTAKQRRALYEVRKYLENNPELGIGTSIFAFEGLATPRSEDEVNWNGINMYHPNGQFGAIVIVIVDGKLEYVVKASTLPDDMETYATVCEGIYEIKDCAHGKDNDLHFEGYAALCVNENQNIPAYNSLTGNNYANAIHVHMAGKLKTDHPGNGSYSQGCITIPLNEYVEFGKKAGFINKQTDENTVKNHTYTSAKWNLEYSSHKESCAGHIVIDRQYYNDVDGYLQYNGNKGK